MAPKINTSETIPAMFFFGIGGAPAILATMIYSMPPIIRLTNLGIRQVPNETIETATAFGSTKSQVLFKVQIPLALPSIMMGVNQTIMMALALVVLATFIGAQGLGSDIWVSLSAPLGVRNGRIFYPGVFWGVRKWRILCFINGHYV